MLEESLTTWYDLRVCRSAVTGRFVSAQFADENPRETTREVIRVKRVLKEGKEPRNANNQH